MIEIKIHIDIGQEYDMIVTKKIYGDGGIPRYLDYNGKFYKRDAETLDYFTEYGGVLVINDVFPKIF